MNDRERIAGYRIAYGPAVIGSREMDPPQRGVCEGSQVHPSRAVPVRDSVADGPDVVRPRSPNRICGERRCERPRSACPLPDSAEAVREPSLTAMTTPDVSPAV